MDVELLIVTYREGERRAPGQMPQHTGTILEGLTPEEAHELRGRLTHTIFQFEEELRDKRPLS